MEADVTVVGLNMMIATNAFHLHLSISGVEIEISVSRDSKLDMNTLKAQAKTSLAVGVKP